MQANGADRPVLGPPGWFIISYIIPPAAVDFLAANQPQAGIKELVLHNTKLPRLRSSKRERRGDRVSRSRRQASTDPQSFPDENARFGGGSNGFGSGVGGLLELDRSHRDKNESGIKRERGIDGRIRKREMQATRTIRRK